MGKKGGKKGKIEKAVENDEPNLPSIPEEDPLLENKELGVTSREPSEFLEQNNKKRKSSVGAYRKSQSIGNLEHRESRKSGTDAGRKSYAGNDAERKIKEDSDPDRKSFADTGEGRKSKADTDADAGRTSKADVQIAQDIVTNDENAGTNDVAVESKTKKGKKGKKIKKETLNTDEDQDQAEKPENDKNSEKAHLESEDVGEEKGIEKTLKRGKKGTKVKGKSKEEAPVDENKPIGPPSETAEADLSTKKQKKTKKVKIEKGKETVEEGGGEQEQEGQPRKKNPKQEKVKTVSKQTQEDGLDLVGQSFEAIPREMEKCKKFKGKARRKASLSEKRISLISDDSQESLKLSPSGRIPCRRSSGAGMDYENRKSSKMSAGSSYSSTETALSEKSSTDVKKGKKAKKQKKEKRVETKEEKQRKKEEKEAKKKSIKEAKKAAKKEAESKRIAELGEKKDLNYDEVKMLLENLKTTAREMGIDEQILATVAESDEQGPRKKISKKERAKITAEMAEKQKAEVEAQAKRLEEIVKKKKEEQRLAAIELDKREILEQTQREEQLLDSYLLIQDIEDCIAAINKEEQDLTEWKKYVECGKLPNPAMFDQMNTYLHLWELDLENTSIDDASKRTIDVLKLMCHLDELIDTATIEDSHKQENWKWIRQLFREHQSASLDVATYRLLRNVEVNLNRINIPNADFNFKDDYVTLCLWLRVMLPTPLPNPRRPPKPRVDIFFNLMDVSVLFPTIIDCDHAAIRAMYQKYDHLSDLSQTFSMPNVPKDYYMDLLNICKKEWRTKLLYKYDHRDRPPLKSAQREQHQENSLTKRNMQQLEPKASEHDERKIKFEYDEEFDSDQEIPLVPFKQLSPTANEYATIVEDTLYSETRTNLLIEVSENVINLRKFMLLGGLFHLNLLAQPPQPQDFITMDMTITGLYLPKKLEVLPFKVVYTPYIPPEPEPTDSNTSVRKLPEELEEEMKKQDEELDKLILINIKWPQHVIFLELPVVCRWDNEKKQWSNEEILDVKHNEDKCMLSFRTGVFGIYGLATYRYSNLPFQAYDIKPEVDNSVTVQLTAAILMLEFNIKDGLIAITQLQNSPNMTLQDAVGTYMRLHRLQRMMKEAGIDIFPAFDAFCYVDGCCEKQWAMEQHLYFNMALISNSFNFAWSRWNLQAGRRKIVLQMRQFSLDKGKQKNHQMLLVTPLKATFIECTEVSQAFSEKEVESLKPVVGPNGIVQDKMSLNTLLEAAKFLELQEQRQHQHRATLDSALATTIRPVTAVNGGTTHMQNGTSGAAQTFTLQPVKLLNTSTTTTAVGNVQGQPQPTQTVVISSNNISSTYLQGVQGPISFATASPTTVSTSPQNGVVHNGTPQIKKEQDGHISSTTMSQTQRHRIMHNSFDIMNPLVIDEGGLTEQKKIRQPPMVFRSGTREVHNKLEKHRRAHLKECFDILKKQLPSSGEEKKTSNLSILHSAFKCIQTLKRRERDFEDELERLAREKIQYQQRLATLKKDSYFDNVDFSKLLPEIPSSTTSITQNGGCKRDINGLFTASPSPSRSSVSPTARVISPSYTVVEPMKMEHIIADDTYCEMSDDASACLTLGNTASVVTMASSGMVTLASSCMATVSSSGIATDAGSSPVINQTNSVITTTNGESKISIPILGKTLPIVTTAPQPTGTKEMTQPVQTAGISVLPMPYSVNQGLVLQKVAIMPHKGLTELTPLVSTHFITTPQQLNGINGQINGKVVPLTQYIVKPMVVVSNASTRPGS